MDKALIQRSCTDPEVIAIRTQMAAKASASFLEASNEMIDFQNMVCVEKANINRQWLEKETQAISIISAIAGDLTDSATLLFSVNKSHSASALLRQLVEIEYLAYAFECEPSEARMWIESNKQIRMEFFSPAKLRKAANGRFRSKDYGYHCELGGHPVPDSVILLNNKDNIAQLMLSDMISHAWRIWDHLVKWAMKSYDSHPIMRSALNLIKDFEHWEQHDILTKLPEPA